MELKINQEFKDLIPPLSQSEFKQLQNSIAQHGILSAICVWEGAIVDGHNRYRIAKEYDMTFGIIQMDFRNEEEAKTWILENQFGRRNLSAYDRGVLALRYKELLAIGAKKNQGRRTDLMPYTVESYNTREKIAKMAEVSTGTIAKVEVIERDASDEVKSEIRKGALSIDKAYGDLRREQIRQENFDAELTPIERAYGKCWNGKYDVIIIDTPWQMRKRDRDTRAEQVNATQPGMTDQELGELEIPMADNCHAFIWATQKHLPTVFRLIDKWELKYSCTFTWNKNGGMQPIGLPQFNSEFVVYARRGNPQFNCTKNFKTCFSANRTGAGQKPEEFYDMIRNSTQGRRLAMFSAQKFDGFNSG